MDQNIETHKLTSQRLCDKLINELKMNEEEIGIFFGGDIKRMYLIANDHALDKAKSIRAQLRGL